MTEFTDWRTLATFGGTAAAAAALTQLLKPLLSKLKFKINYRIVSYICSLVILITATVISGGCGAPEILLCFINAAVVSLSSNGGYDLTVELFNYGNEEDDDENNS